MDNDLTDPVIGTFDGRDEGDFFNIDGRAFRLTYTGGDGNDVAIEFVNSAPAMDDVADQTVDEGGTLTLSMNATDAESPPESLRYFMDGPPGATLDPVTGVFTWTPTEVQGGGTYWAHIGVVDDGTPDLVGSVLFRITVNDVNSAPQLSNIGSDYEVEEGSTLTFTPTATDTDVPVNVLTFELVGAHRRSEHRSRSRRLHLDANRGPGAGDLLLQRPRHR